MLPLVARDIAGEVLMRKRDPIDTQLIAILSEAARTSTSEIARRLNLPRSTVNERIARLEHDGIILGYAAMVAPDCDGLRTRAHLHLQIRRNRVADVVDALRGFPEIMDCLSVSGPDGLLCIVMAPCAEDVDALIDDLMDVDGIDGVSVTMVLARKFERRTASPSIARGEHLSLVS